MPTPVSAARQCLTGDAARALDDAVAVARRRSHAQTTSLHAISALLALPSSTLREACLRSRTFASSSAAAAVSPRLQFRALDLSFSVALDRLQSSHSHPNAAAGGADADPPISNSLMAAIKRSQANQRRNPESFFLQHQQQQHPSSSASSSPTSNSSSSSSSSALCVKVDLQPLILSILDDPIVSRVFADAGFRSCDIKLAILRPLPSLRAPRPRCPPLFLCNFPELDAGGRRPSFNFPFSGASAFGGCSSSSFPDFDENCRRIAEVLARSKGRNPLLVGVCARDALRSFADYIQRGAEAAPAIPKEIVGLKYVCVEEELAGKEELPGTRLDELGQLAEHCAGPGVAVSLGDLNALLTDAASQVIGGLTKLLELRRGRLWLMGSAANYETYMKFSRRYPSIEKDWDLHLLPITSPAVGGIYPRPQSKVYDTLPQIEPKVKGYFMCKQEVATLKGCNVSVADQSQANLPGWLRQADLVSTKSVAEALKAKDDGTALNTKIAEVQKKWNDNCQRLHHGFQMLGTDSYHGGHHLGPSGFGFQHIANTKERADGSNIRGLSTFQSAVGYGHAVLMSTTHLKTTSAPDLNKPVTIVSESKGGELLLNLEVNVSKGEPRQTDSLRSHSSAPTDAAFAAGHSPPSLLTPVTTDLALGTLCVPPDYNLKKPTVQTYSDHLQQIPGCSPAGVVAIQSPPSYSDSMRCNGYLSMQVAPNHQAPCMAAPNSCLLGSCNMTEQFGHGDFKTLWRGLLEKVGRQDEALRVISQAIVHCKAGNERRRGASLKGDIWLCLCGPDRVGKKRVALSLAEMVFGSKQNLICLDLSTQDGFTHSNAIFDLCQAVDGLDERYRGKTVTAYIAGEISKKPLSVVFLENVDRADMVLQNSLSQAIKTGKFPDSYGREVGINNTIFVTTTRTLKSKTSTPTKECVDFSEERILVAQGWQMKISVHDSILEVAGNEGSNVFLMSPSSSGNDECNWSRVVVNKRKLDKTSNHKMSDQAAEPVKRLHRMSNMHLDLNLAAEEVEADDADGGSNDSDNISENTEAWLEEFSELMDESVAFKPFDFDALADSLLKKIKETFQTAFGSTALLEIDFKVMEQILAATWVLEETGAVQGWIEKVLGRSFLEARERYGRKSSAHSVLRLSSREGHLMEQKASGVCLPARIILN
ncbi:hypothetical protein ACLOJK_025651 [Asimina triloba]